jgi:hypothetical protein
LKKLDSLILTFYDQEQNVLLSRKLTAVPLRDKAIRALSMTYYSDPEPCIIHRSAVMNRIFMEVSDYFEKFSQRGLTQCSVAELPGEFLTYFDLADYEQIGFMFGQ